MIAIVHSIYSQSVHAPARDAGLMDNDAERYCIYPEHYYTVIILNFFIGVQLSDLVLKVVYKNI